MTRREIKIAIFEGLMLLLVLLFLCMIPSELKGQDAPIAPIKVNGLDGNIFRNPTLYLPMFCTSGLPLSLSGQAVFYCDPSTNTLKVSVNGGAFTAVTLATPVAVTNGGTGQSSAAVNQVLIGSGPNAYALATLPNCTTANNFFQYNNSTQTFTCAAAAGGFKFEATNTTPVTATTVAATTLQTFSLPANEIAAGQTLHWEDWGNWANGPNGTIATLALKVDGTAVCTLVLSVSGASQGPLGYHLSIDVSATSTAAAEVHCHLATQAGNLSTTTVNIVDTNNTTKAIDFTGVRSLTETVAWDIATGGGGWIHRSSAIVRLN